MKYFYLIISTYLTLLLSAQTPFNDLEPPNTFQNADNPYYWKNKLPFPGYWQQDVHYKINADIDEKSINAVKKAFYEFITLYRLYHFSNEEHRLCGLCGNTGELDTSSTAVSPRGLKPGGKYPCFCPLGRVSRNDKYDTIKSPFVLHYKKDTNDR